MSKILVHCTLHKHATSQSRFELWHDAARKSVVIHTEIIKTFCCVKVSIGASTVPKNCGTLYPSKNRPPYRSGSLTPIFWQKTFFDARCPSYHYFAFTNCAQWFYFFLHLNINFRDRKNKERLDMQAEEEKEKLKNKKLREKFREIQNEVNTMKGLMKELGLFKQASNRSSATKFELIWTNLFRISVSREILWQILCFQL